MKICSKCKFEKPFEEFSKNKSMKDGFDNHCKSCKKEYYILNREVLIQKMKQNYLDNREERIEQSKVHYLNNRDEKLKYNKEYYEINKDELCKKSKEYISNNIERKRERDKKYKKENRDKVNAREAAREAKKLQASPKWLTKEHFKSIERFYVISKEMELISGVKYHVDHIVPLQGNTVCGLHVPWNLQILDARENIAKGNKLLDQDQKFYHQIPEFDDLMENICEKY